VEPTFWDFDKTLGTHLTNAGERLDVKYTYLSNQIGFEYSRPGGPDEANVGLCVFGNGLTRVQYFGPQVLVQGEAVTAYFTGFTIVNYDGGDDGGPSQPADGDFDYYRYSYDTCRDKLATVHVKCDYPTSCNLPDGRKAISDPAKPSALLPGCDPEVGFPNCRVDSTDSIDPPLLDPETLDLLDSISARYPGGTPFGSLGPQGCDLNADDACDGADRMLLESAIGTCAGDEEYRPNADVDVATNEACVTSLDRALLFPICGDGVAGLYEVCDDGNAIANDGCESDCSLTGSRAAQRLSGRLLKLKDDVEASKRLLKVLSKDTSISLGEGNGATGDPVATAGSTLRIHTAGGCPQGPCDSTYLLRGTWQYLGQPGENKGYKYKDPSGPIRSIVLKPGKTLKMVGRGELRHTLTVDPTSVDIVLRLGTEGRYCMAFGGVTVFRPTPGGSVFHAENAPRASGCAP
jgi:cysteine-rich repeat protein